MKFSVMVTAVARTGHQQYPAGEDNAKQFTRLTEELGKDISNLAQNAAAIDESFESVSRRMERCKVQHPIMTEKLCGDLDGLIEKWKKNHQVRRHHPSVSLLSESNPWHRNIESSCGNPTT